MEDIVSKSFEDWCESLEYEAGGDMGEFTPLVCRAWLAAWEASAKNYDMKLHQIVEKHL